MVWQLLGRSIAKKAVQNKAKNAAVKKGGSTAAKTAGMRGGKQRSSIRVAGRSTVDEIHRQAQEGYSSIERTRNARLERKRSDNNNVGVGSTQNNNHAVAKMRQLGRNGLVRKSLRSAIESSQTNESARQPQKIMEMAKITSTLYFIWLNSLFFACVEMLGLIWIYAKNSLWDWTAEVIDWLESFIVSGEQVFYFAWLVISAVSIAGVVLVYFKLKKVYPDKDHQTGLIISLVLCCVPIIHFLPIAIVFSTVSSMGELFGESS